MRSLRLLFASSWVQSYSLACLISFSPLYLFTVFDKPFYCFFQSFSCQDPFEHFFFQGFENNFFNFSFPSLSWLTEKRFPSPLLHKHAEFTPPVVSWALRAGVFWEPDLHECDVPVHSFIKTAHIFWVWCACALLYRDGSHILSVMYLCTPLWRWFTNSVALMVKWPQPPLLVASCYQPPCFLEMASSSLCV